MKVVPLDFLYMIRARGAANIAAVNEFAATSTWHQTDEAEMELGLAVKDIIDGLPAARDKTLHGKLAVKVFVPENLIGDRA